EVVNLSDEHAVRDALRAVLSGTVADTLVFDQAFTVFFYPGPAGVRQDQMPSTRRELGADADGRDANTERARHAPPLSADAADTSEAGHGPMTPLETTDGASDEPALFAPS